MVWPPYRVAVRLYAVAAEHWTALNGEFAFRTGASLLSLYPGTLCDVTYHWATRGMEEVDKARFDDALYRVIPGQKADKDDAAREMDAFAAFSSAMGG